MSNRKANGFEGLRLPAGPPGLFCPRADAPQGTAVLETCSIYTRTLLSFRLGDGGGRYSLRPASPQAGAPMRRRAATGKWLLLLGAGSGEFAHSLAASLAPDTGFLVLELYPEVARPLADSLPLLCDSSPVALAWMLLSLGLFRGCASLALNPEIADPTARERFQTVQRLHAAYAPLEPDATAPAEAPELTVAAILHPDEPGLEDFFASLPACASQAVVVWDAQAPPGTRYGAPMPVTHLAHRLDADFAAQRNRMLAACRTGWTLYLDADERLDPMLAAILPALTAQNTCGCFAFPRFGVRPAGTVIGWGLWPDLQTRLFKNSPDVRFVRPVHERLEGLRGPMGLCLGLGIRHLSGMLKSPGQLARKHALFDTAGGRPGLHKVNEEYPVVSESFFASPPFQCALGLWPDSIRL